MSLFLQPSAPLILSGSVAQPQHQCDQLLQMNAHRNDVFLHTSLLLRLHLAYTLTPEEAKMKNECEKRHSWCSEGELVRRSVSVA